MIRVKKLFSAPSISYALVSRSSCILTLVKGKKEKKKEKRFKRMQTLGEGDDVQEALESWKREFDGTPIEPAGFENKYKEYVGEWILEKEESEAQLKKYAQAVVIYELSLIYNFIFIFIFIFFFFYFIFFFQNKLCVEKGKRCW